MALWISVMVHAALASGFWLVGMRAPLAPPENPVAVELMMSAPAVPIAREEASLVPAPAVMSPAEPPPIPEPAATLPAVAVPASPAPPPPAVPAPPAASRALQAVLLPEHPGVPLAPAGPGSETVGTRGAATAVIPSARPADAAKPRSSSRAPARDGDRRDVPPHEGLSVGPVDVSRLARPSPPAAPAPPAVTIPAHPVAGMSSNRPPAYPAVAQRRREEGRVIVRVAVSADGAPLSVNISASSGHDLLDEAAVTAVLNWRFVPALRNGVAVAANAEVPVDFRLQR